MLVVDSSSAIRTPNGVTRMLRRTCGVLGMICKYPHSRPASVVSHLSTRPTSLVCLADMTLMRLPRITASTYQTSGIEDYLCAQASMHPAEIHPCHVRNGSNILIVYHGPCCHLPRREFGGTQCTECIRSRLRSTFKTAILDTDRRDVNMQHGSGSACTDLHPASQSPSWA